MGDRSMTSTHALVLKIAAVLWVIWGLIHILAGSIIIPADASGGFSALADAVDPAGLCAGDRFRVGRCGLPLATQ